MVVKLGIILGLFAAVALSGANPVGAVSSMGPIEVSGTTLAASTVSSWPLVGGDVIATNNSAAVVFLTGKGRVTLDANTRVRVERKGEQVSVHLLGGGLVYDLLPGSDVLFYNGSRSVTPGAQTQGSVATAANAQITPPRFSTVMPTARPKPSVIGP